MILGLSAAVVALAFACSDDKALREATAQDLENLVLQEEDLPGWRLVSAAENSGPTPFYDVNYEPQTASEGDVLCVNTRIEASRDSQQARDAFQRGLETLQADQVSMMQPAGLPDGALLYHFSTETVNCSHEAPGHVYTAVFLRANAIGILTESRRDEAGPEHLVSLLERQVKRVEAVLSED